jgi:BASS family bile acid:Na+ symporter
MAVSMWVIVGLSLFLNRNALVDILGEGAIFVSALFFMLAYAPGYISGGLDKPVRPVLGLGAAQRNFAAAIVVATQAFDEPRILVMTVVMSVVALPLIPFSSFLGRQKGKGDEFASPLQSR